MSAMSTALAWARLAKIPDHPSPTRLLKTQIALLSDSLRKTSMAVFARQSSNLTAGVARLRRGLTSLARALLVLCKATLRGAVLASLALTTAMLWALYYMPLEKRVGIDGPSVLVEAANGQPLGRVGPLSDAVKRQDFPDTLVKAVLSIEDRRFFQPLGDGSVGYRAGNAGELGRRRHR